ncbi:MAG: CRISPR-associated endonuclease Cas1 [Burkholderiales bacterium]|nr:CRISPR-associated endonuclease Cas1 [Burkholderiales bacterium]
MTTLVLDNRALELKADGKVLTVYEDGEHRTSLPLAFVERLVVQGDARLTAGVLTRLAEAGAAVLFLSKRHARRLAIVLGPAHNDAAVRLAQAQRVADPVWCGLWAQHLVRAKLRAQRRWLKAALTERPDARKALTDALESLEAALQALASRAESPEVERCRGVEGAAARAYFQALAALVPPAFAFTGRNRRPPRDPVNALLSLTYTLLHFEAVRASHMAGLDPLIGFYHRPAFGRESLASDLIEPLRPRADAWVWRLLARQSLRPSHFRRDGEACLLGKDGRELYYAAYEDFARPLRRLLRRQARLLARGLRQQGLPLLATEEEETAA